MDLSEKVKRATELRADINALLGSTPSAVAGAFAESDLRQVEQVKTLMGKNFIGEEAYRKLGVRDVGTLPPLPSAITPALLNAGCPIVDDGRCIRETHRLVFIPAKVDDKDFTINLLRELATAKESELGRDRIFDNADWYTDEEFAKKSIGTSGTWILMPGVDLSNTREKNFAHQGRVLARRYPDYKTAKALELVTAMVMNYVQNNERIYPDFFGLCEDALCEDAISAAGPRVSAGYFDACGLHFDIDPIASPHDRLSGRAVVRKLEKT